MKIILVDPVNTGWAHAAWNATIIDAIALLPAACVTPQLCASQASLRLILDGRTASRAMDNALTQGPRALTFGLRQSAYLARSLKAVNALVRRDKPSDVIFLAADNTLVPSFLRAFGRAWHRRGVRVTVFFHSNLQHLRGSPAKCQNWKAALHNAGAQLLVLAPFLAEAAGQLLPGTAVSVIPNPTYSHLYSGPMPASDEEQAGDFLFAPSHAWEAERSGFLNAFLSTCTSAFPSGRVSIGLPSDIPAQLKVNNVAERRYTRPPDLTSYVRLLRSFRFAIVPPSLANQLRPSGIAADLLTIGTPVVAPDAGVWRWQQPPITQQFLYRSLDDLPRLLQSAIALTADERTSLRVQIKQASSQFDLEKTSYALAGALGRDHHGSPIHLV